MNPSFTQGSPYHGITMSPSGELSGTPTEVTTVYPVVRVTDALGRTDLRQFEMSGTMNSTRKPSVGVPRMIFSPAEASVSIARSSQSQS